MPLQPAPPQSPFVLECIFWFPQTNQNIQPAPPQSPARRLRVAHKPAWTRGGTPASDGERSTGGTCRATVSFRQQSRVLDEEIARACSCGFASHATCSVRRLQPGGAPPKFMNISKICKDDHESRSLSKLNIPSLRICE